MTQRPPARDRYGRFRRRTPSCWNERRNTQKNLKTYTKTSLGGRPVVEIETRIYKKPAVPAVRAENTEEDEDDPFADQRPEKRRKTGESSKTSQPQHHGRPDSNILHVWKHPNRMSTQQIRRMLPHQAHGEEMGAIGTALRKEKERGTVGYPEWKPRPGFEPSAHLLKLFKKRQNVQTEPPANNHPNVGMDENSPIGGQSSCRIQNGSNGGEAQTMGAGLSPESRIWEGLAMPQRPVPVLPALTSSPPLFCSPDNNQTRLMIKSLSRPYSVDSTPPRGDRSPSTPPPRFRFTSPIPTERDTPTPAPHSNPKRRRGIPFRKAFLVPSVEGREISTISETPLSEMEARECSPDLDEVNEPDGLRETGQEQLGELRELVHRSRVDLNQSLQEPLPEASQHDSDQSQGLQKIQPKLMPEFRHRFRSHSGQPGGSPQAKQDLVNNSDEFTTRIVPPIKSTGLSQHRVSPRSRDSTPDSEAESEVTSPCPITKLPQSTSSPSSTSSTPPSSPILPLHCARSISESEEASFAEPSSTLGSMTDDSMSSPQQNYTAATPPSGLDSLSTDGYCLVVSKFDAAGNKSMMRTINVPAAYTLEQLHKGLLSAFCLPPNLRYTFGLLKLSAADKTKGFGYTRPYPRKRLLLAGAWGGGFETNWRAGAIGVHQLMGEIEGDPMLDLWWSHEKGGVWTHRVECVAKRKGVGRAWCTGESGLQKIFFGKE